MTYAHSRLAAIIVLFLFAINIYAQTPKLGDESDGNRSVPIHLIDMLDEQGIRIHSDVFPQQPFSTKQTCNECHTYDIISSGWHFNAGDSGVVDGRPGQPWIISDALTATQIPVHYRNWQGIFRPADLGISNFEFAEKFGRHMPGGAAGERSEQDSPDHFIRWMISGELEVNCMACHDADLGHDQAEYATNARKQNFRWAATSAMEFAQVEGTAKEQKINYDVYSGIGNVDSRSLAPRVTYSPGTFNSKDKTLFNIVKHVPNERCYYCHSTKFIGGEKEERWQWDEDIHLKAGMKCVDCHRNGMDHNMVRGYEGEVEDRGDHSVASFSCAGCHINEDKSSIPQAGRMGAPTPEHKGIPIIHFEKLTCTSCHSGPWPSENSYTAKSSVTHEMGVHGAKKADGAAPHIAAPVFIKNKDGKLEPRKIIYPSFWTFVKDDSLSPILPDVIKPYVFDFVIQVDSTVDSINVAQVLEGLWPNFTEDNFKDILDTLSTLDSTKQVGYVSDGLLYTLGDNGALVSKKHEAGNPYSWAIGHDVRPASQSLGVRGCTDCHSLNSGFHFGDVTLASAIAPDNKNKKSMLSFQNVGVLYPRLFALTFLVRPLYKIFLILIGLVLVAVLIKFTLKGLDGVFKSVSGKDW
jgi:hypothetical protein